MWNFFINLDRRWIFASMFVVIGVPLLAGLRVPEIPTSETEDAFAAVESISSGSNVLVALDYDPASAPELHPMAAALIRHAASRECKLYFVTLWPGGNPLVQELTTILQVDFPNYKYGENFVNLGFRSGNQGVIKLFATEFRKAATLDYLGNSLDAIPMTKDIRDIQQFDMLINVSAGYPGAKEWVQLVSTPKQLKTVVGTTGVQAPQIRPYVPGQVAGLITAIKGAAEYESLLADKYQAIKDNPRSQDAHRRMGAQLVGHLFLIALIIFGNIIHLRQRKQKS